VLGREHSDLVECRINDNPILADEKTGNCPPPEQMEDLNWCDVILISNILKFGGPYTMRVMETAKKLGKFVHFDTDDLLTGLYPEHYLYGVYKENKLDEITKWLYYNADLVSVTQKKFAQRIQPFCSKVIAILRNAIDYKLPCWNEQKKEAKFTKIGWAGGTHHRPDLDKIAGVPHILNQKVGRENVRWQLYGAPPPDPNKKGGWEANVWPEYLSKFLKGFAGQKNFLIYPALPPDQYGVYYSDMDIAIAPLQMNDFNDSKSDIKVAEAGRYKMPLIASNVGCYSDTIINGKTGYLIDPDAPALEWVRILTKVCKDKKLRIEMGENLHQVTEQYFDQNKVCRQRLEIYARAFQELGYKLK